MKYKICSSFPFEKMMQAHLDKEKEILIESMENDDSVAYQDRVLITMMSARIPHEYSKHYGTIIHNQKTKELLHYVESTDHHVSDLVNSGVYLLSVRIFNEFKLSGDELFDPGDEDYFNIEPTPARRSSITGPNGKI